MNKYTHFEDLSTEIFFEIFDYLNALQILTSFTSLNKRISSILQLIPLRVSIPYNSCRREIEFLSSHLTFHDHQVISIDIFDTIRDYSSVINLLFGGHNFINLERCIFHSINLSTNLTNIIKQINMNRLITFSIRESKINENDKHDLTQTILMYESSSLRSITLQYRYDYLDVLNYSSISSNVISLHLWISGTPSTVSVSSILSIFRICRTIRYLRIILEHQYPVENNNVNISSQTPSINDNDLPILSQLILCDLKIFAICDIQSISYVLRCMPNLIRLYFTLATRSSGWPFPGELLDGCVWKQMLELYNPHLSTFEFHMSSIKSLPKLYLDIIVNSFKCLVTKYPNWHMVIERWIFNSQTREEFVMLRTLNYQKSKSGVYSKIPCICWPSFETRSTLQTKTDHHLFYTKEKVLRIFMTNRRPTITWYFPLFQQITYLQILMSNKNSSLWDNLLNIVNFSETNDVDDEQENLICLSQFVQLANITELEFRSPSDGSRWKDIQYILQACPNVTDLTIGTPLLLLSKLINNPSLIPIFKQIKMVKSITEKFYFPPHFALKFLERFPSLVDIELQVFSFDHCVSIIETFLGHLKNLSYVKINYYQDTLLDDPFSRDYIIEKRRQTFPNNILNEQMINVVNNGETIEIWLS